MSSNPRNIITGLKPRTINSNNSTATPFQYFGLPRSSDYLKSSKSGFVSNPYQHVLECVNSISATDEDALKTQSDAQIIKLGNYIPNLADLSYLSPSLFTPNRLLITFDLAADRTLYFPTATNLINHLRGLYGVENVVAGLSWEITMINISVGGGTGFAASLATAGGSGVTINGTSSVLSGRGDFEAGTADIPNTRKFRFVLTSVEDTVTNPYSYEVYSYY